MADSSRRHNEKSDDRVVSRIFRAFLSFNNIKSFLNTLRVYRCCCDEKNGGSEKLGDTSAAGLGFSDIRIYCKIQHSRALQNAESSTESNWYRFCGHPCVADCTSLTLGAWLEAHYTSDLASAHGWKLMAAWRFPPRESIETAATSVRTSERLNFVGKLQCMGTADGS